MSIHCRGGLKWNRATRWPAYFVRLLGLLVVLFLIGSPGCINLFENAAGTVSIELIPGEKADGELFSDQRLRAVTLVEAGHVYEFRVGLTVSIGPSGPGEIEGVVSGIPLAGPVEFSVGSSGGGLLESGPPTTLVALLDGEVTLEFVFSSADEADAAGDALEAIRRLIGGPARATYELLWTDLGFDDNGSSPEDAVALAVGPAGELTGTLTPGDEADYFLLQVQAETAYQLNLEATDPVDLSVGSEDRFGQINFGVPTAGGLTIAVSASAGVPGIDQFTAPATEGVVLRLAASGLVSSSGVTIQYALGVVEAVPDETPEQD